MYEFELAPGVPSREDLELLPGDCGRGADVRALACLYSCLAESASTVTRPLVLRIRRAGRPAAAIPLVRCSSIGPSLFAAPVAADLFSATGFPCHLWIRGPWHDVVANPGFFADPEEADTISAAAVRWLADRCLCFVGVDDDARSPLHHGALRLSYVVDGFVDTAGPGSAGDFVRSHRHLRHLLNIFSRRGGTVETVGGRMDAGDAARAVECVGSIAGRSVIHAPFQDIYPALVSSTCLRGPDSLVHFIARQDGVLVGYHSFMPVGDCLCLLHGAFDRTRSTNDHAYEAVMTGAVLFALREGYRRVRFGPVFNRSKMRLMGGVTGRSYYVGSSAGPFLHVIGAVMRRSRYQSPGLLEFSADGAARKESRAELNPFR